MSEMKRRIIIRQLKSFFINKEKNEIKTDDSKINKKSRAIYFSSGLLALIMIEFVKGFIIFKDENIIDLNPMLFTISLINILIVFLIFQKLFYFIMALLLLTESD